VAMTIRAGCSVGLFVLVALGCTSDRERSFPTASATPETLRRESGKYQFDEQFGADVPNSWFGLAYDLVQAEKLSPPVASRIFAYAGVGLYEAVRPGLPGYRSLAGQLHGLAPLPRVGGQAPHWPLVANSALAAVFNSMFASGSQATRDAIAALEHQWHDQFAGDLPPGIVNVSELRGRAVASAIIEWSGSDGYASLHGCPYAPPAGPGLWIPTPPAFASALEPCWGQLRPFALTYADVCDPGPPPAYSVDPASQFMIEATEVFHTVKNLNDEQMTIALFWADNPGQTGTPPGHSISITRQILGLQGASLGRAAEAYARVGMAVADAFIACWWSKFEYDYLRPVTCIRDLIEAGWLSPVVTPPFPEYTSGHSVQSGAVAQVLTDLFGPLAFTDHTHDALGLAPRSFDSFFAFADEAAISRLYGGIHFRSAIDLGVEQGKCIGAKVSALNLDGPALP